MASSEDPHPITVKLWNCRTSKKKRMFSLKLHIQPWPESSIPVARCTRRPGPNELESEESFYLSLGSRTCRGSSFACVPLIGPPGTGQPEVVESNRKVCSAIMTLPSRLQTRLRGGPLKSIEKRYFGTVRVHIHREQHAAKARLAGESGNRAASEIM